MREWRLHWMKVFNDDMSDYYLISLLVIGSQVKWFKNTRRHVFVFTRTWTCTSTSNTTPYNQLVSLSCNLLSNHISLVLLGLFSSLLVLLARFIHSFIHSFVDSLIGMTCWDWVVFTLTSAVTLNLSFNKIGCTELEMNLKQDKHEEEHEWSKHIHIDIHK